MQSNSVHVRDIFVYRGCETNFVQSRNTNRSRHLKLWTVETSFNRKEEYFRSSGHVSRAHWNLPASKGYDEIFGAGAMQTETCSTKKSRHHRMHTKVKLIIIWKKRRTHTTLRWLHSMQGRRRASAYVLLNANDQMEHVSNVHWTEFHLRKVNRFFWMHAHDAKIRPGPDFIGLP